MDSFGKIFVVALSFATKRILLELPSSLPQNCVLYTRRLVFSALDLLPRKIVNIGCHCLGHQIEGTLIQCGMKALFGVLGSEK